MSKTNPYEKHFIILSQDDMDKLSAGWPVHLDGDEYDPPVSIFTEEGYQTFQQFWGEDLLDDPINDIIDAS